MSRLPEPPDAYPLSAYLRIMFGIESKRLGRVQFPAPVKFSSVKLTGKSAVSTGMRILEYAGNRYRDDLETCPF